ncbi:SDR family NAD(P)-dependent oxidoreductase [Undibacterium sp. Ji67W]|uniref:SDR family NAD(P)-dependent oxidoreductase n=1 Tax=Undibacterium sp. Ji67W TaxID=3413042 RepID=UPI003BF3A38E
MMNNDSQKPHALVVGASSGIGYAMAQRLSETHRVTALARRTDRLASLVEMGVSAVYCDVADLDSIAAIVEQSVATNGKVSALIYCAGLQMIRPMRTVKVTDIRQVIDVNLSAALVFGQLMASQRISEAQAVYCAVSSISAQRPEPAIIPYAVAKAGIEAMIKGLARELAPRRAIGVAPGWLDTEMTQSFKQIYNDAFKEQLMKKSPTGIATVDAVADLIEFLISPKAAFITGQIITIDGGASL